MNKPLLITDLDGTLIKDSEKIHPNDKDVFTHIHKKFVTGIATGRSIKEITFIEEQLGFEVEVKIGFNGAIMEIKDERIFDHHINRKDVQKLLYFLEKNQIKFDALDGDTRMGTHQTSNKRKLWNMKLHEPDDMMNTILNKTIYKINIRPVENNSDALLAELIESFPNLTICKSGETRIEVTASGISKGLAIQYLKKYENYGPIIATGDSENDITLFQEADLSFCIKSAQKNVKEHADFVMDYFSTLKKLTYFS